MIVVDTNVLAALLLRDERYAAVRAVAATDDAWAAPPLWRSEFTNVLWKMVRHGGLDPDDAFTLYTEAQGYVDDLEDVSYEEVLRGAIESGCSAYDCVFVVAAVRTGVPLVTFDRKLLAAFPDVAVSPEGFVA